MRHVLPTSIDYLEDISGEKAQQIKDCDVNVLLGGKNLEDPNIFSDFIMQMVVEKANEENKFLEYTMDLVSDGVLRLLENRLTEAGLEERVLMLIENDETGAMSTACAVVFESIVADLLTARDGVSWQRRPNVLATNGKDAILTRKANNTKVSSWEPFKLKLKRVVRGLPPQFEDMTWKRKFSAIRATAIIPLWNSSARPKLQKTLCKIRHSSYIFRSQEKWER